jgi:hypothetical protein
MLYYLRLPLHASSVQPFLLPLSDLREIWIDRKWRRAERETGGGATSLCLKFYMLVNPDPKLERERNWIIVAFFSFLRLIFMFFSKVKKRRTMKRKWNWCIFKDFGVNLPTLIIFYFADLLILFSKRNAP